MNDGLIGVGNADVYSAEDYIRKAVQSKHPVYLIVTYLHHSHHISVYSNK